MKRIGMDEEDRGTRCEEIEVILSTTLFCVMQAMSKRSLDSS